MIEVINDKEVPGIITLKELLDPKKNMLNSDDKIILAEKTITQELLLRIGCNEYIWGSPYVKQSSSININIYNSPISAIEDALKQNFKIFILDNKKELKEKINYREKEEIKDKK